ncbi:MAG TPA: hypothetical protein VGL39_13365 [Jatrophihabitantaceae bacterium]|jgi:hypothetical protein
MDASKINDALLMAEDQDLLGSLVSRRSNRWSDGHLIDDRRRQRRRWLPCGINHARSATALHSKLHTAIALIGSQAVVGVRWSPTALHGRRQFNDVELDMTMTSANHAAVALEVTNARA